MVGEASGRMQKADCRDEIALPAAMLAWLKCGKQRTRNSRKRFLVFFCSLFVKARVVYRLLITTVVAKVIKSKEKEESVKFTLPDGSVQEATRIKFSTKLGWLNKLLWGGSALLAFEHLWHGEVVPFFPFLTAVENGETADMLAEMGSAGVMMAVLVTAVWCGMLAVSSFMEKRAIRDCKLVKEGM